MEKLLAEIQKELQKFLIQLQGNKEAEVKLATTGDINKAVENAKKALSHGLTNLLFKELELCLNLKN